MQQQAPKPDADTRMGGWVGVGYDEIEVGRAFAPQDLPVSAQDLADFYRCLGEERPAPVAGTRIPAFMLNELRALKRQMRLPPGVLHAQEELRQHSAAHLGDRLQTAVRIADKYIRNGKRFVVVEQDVTCADDNRPILNIRHILYWPC
jgi:hypothetical protein